MAEYIEPVGDGDLYEPLEIDLALAQREEILGAYRKLREDLECSMRVAQALDQGSNEIGEMSEQELAGSKLEIRCALVLEGLEQNSSQVALTVRAIQNSDLSAFQDLKKISDGQGPRDNMVARVEDAIDEFQRLHDEAWSEAVELLGEEAEKLRQELSR